MGIKRIAVEEAFVTQDIADEWSRVLAGRFVEPGFQKMGETILGDGPGARSLHARLLDVGAGRIAQMDADGIDLAVVSITSPGVQVFDAVTATRLAQHANDVLAEAIRAYPQRLAGLAAVAPQFPGGAAVELERAVRTLGMKGFLVNSHTKSEYLDDRNTGRCSRRPRLYGHRCTCIPASPRRPWCNRFWTMGCTSQGSALLSKPACTRCA